MNLSSERKAILRVLCAERKAIWPRSKLCKTEAEADETVQWYKDNYDAKKYPYDSPKWRMSHDGVYYVVFNESTGKILKSVNYSPVDLKPLCGK